MKTEHRVRAPSAARYLPRSLRWPLLGFALALGILAAVSNAQAQKASCSQYTEPRACTVMEEFGYCLTTAIDVFDSCLDGAGFWGRIGCTIAYEVDFYGCAAALPFRGFLK